MKSELKILLEKPKSELLEFPDMQNTNWKYNYRWLTGNMSLNLCINIYKEELGKALDEMHAIAQV